MGPEAYLYLAALLFFIGTAGVVIRRNVFFVLMSIELMLNSVNLTLVCFAKIWHNTGGQVFVFFVMAIAAAEACVGLAIAVLFFREKGSVQIDDAREMKN